MDSIEMKIAKIAANNWGQNEPTNLEEAKGITWGSEISSIKGIISVLGLNPELESRMVEEIYTKDKLSEDISKEIQGKIYRGALDKNSSPAIVNMLSVVHDEWVRNNPNNFLRVNKDENGQDKPRNKEYQFVPLQLLSWKEAKSDLLFLKPILEAAGVRIDEKTIEEQFEISQKEFMIDNGIDSIDRLKFKLRQGSDFYPALEGLETKNGGNIEELLKDEEILEKMATQVEGQIDIKSREELAKDIIKSDNKLYSECFHVKTTRYDANFNEDKCPKIDGILSKREILLSKLIGKPYPTYILDGIMDDRHEVYQNDIQEYGLDEGMDSRLWGGSYSRISEYNRQAEKEVKFAKQLGEPKKGKIEFGYTSNGEKIPGDIEVTDTELKKASLNKESMGWQELQLDKKGKVTAKDIAKADQEQSLTTTEVGGIRGFIKKLLDKFKGMGEK